MNKQGKSEPKKSRKDLIAARDSARDDRRPLEYYTISNELGWVDDEDLYNIGKAEFETEEKEIERLLHKYHKDRLLNIEEFLSAAEGVAPADLDADYKKELLTRYFPTRFGANGNQSIYAVCDAKDIGLEGEGTLFENVYSDSDIGHIFDEVRKHSSKTRNELARLVVEEESRYRRR